MKRLFLFIIASLLPLSPLNATEGVGIAEPLSTKPHPTSTPTAPLKIPSLERSPSPALSQQSKILVNRIILEGNTAFNDEELASITQPYIARELSAEDLRQLRHELTMYYIDHGYINSGAVLPEQRIIDGELKINIIEGRLTSIQWEGLEHLSESYLNGRIEKHSENEPLNIKTLQNDLQLIQQNPIIQRINAELTPGIRPGEAMLRARVAEANPWYLTLGTNNQGVPSVGAERFETWGGHRNVLGFGDAFDGHFNISGGQTAFDLSYSLPFTRWDTNLKLGYQRNEADVIEEAFTELNIFNQMEAYSLGISQPVWQTLEDEATLSLLFERRNSQTFLLGSPMAFSKGCDSGKCDVSVVRLSQDWLHRTSSQVVALRSTTSWGLNALGATIHNEQPALPDSRFFAWLGQAQWIQRLWDTGTELHVRGYAQLSDAPLLSLEQFALGGRNSIRGYRENQWVRDNGFSSSVEFRIPLLGDGRLKLAPFFDMGRAWSLDGSDQKQHVLNSAGIGLLFDPIPEIHSEIFWAHAMRTIKNNSQDLQDDGIHFAVTYSPL